MPFALQCALIGVTGLAAVTDLYSRRIPNPIVVAGFVSGILLNTWLSGWQGAIHALMGFGLALLVYIPLFALRAMGGGDVKLMAAAGAIVGPRDWFTLFIFASVVGGVIALGMLMARRSMGTAFWNMMHVATELAHLRLPYQSNAALDISSPQALTMPHGVAIGIGAALLVVFPNG